MADEHPGNGLSAQTAKPFHLIDAAFEMACHLASDAAVGSVSVVVKQQLRYDDLLRYRRRAEASKLSFVVTKTSEALGFRHFRRIRQRERER